MFSNAAGVSTSGILIVIRLPGLKPSARFMSVGSMWTPPMFAGIDSRFRLRRLPVGGRRVVDREVVVRERLQADRRVEEVAAVGVLDRDRPVGLSQRLGVLLQVCGCRSTLRFLPLER